MAKCRNWVLFPHRHAASCRFCSGRRGCLAFLGSLTCKIEEKKERKIVTHIIDARQVFLFTTIGVRSGESRQTPAAKPPCVLEVDCTGLLEAGGRREERSGVACMLVSSCHQA
jgi:hypothetical protein